MSHRGLPKILGTSLINEKGQLVIPAEARKRIGLEAGDRVVIMSKENSSALIVIKSEELEALAQDLAKVLDDSKHNT